MESFGSIIHPPTRLTATQILGAVNDVFQEMSTPDAVAMQWKNNCIYFRAPSPATRAVVQAKEAAIINRAREKIRRRYQQTLPETHLVSRS